MVREGPPQPAPPPKEPRTPTAEEARGGEIILRTKTRRLIFFAGLIGAVVLALVLQVAS